LLSTKFREVFVLRFFEPDADQRPDERISPSLITSAKLAAICQISDWPDADL
jgi:hypothetical protein